MVQFDIQWARILVSTEPIALKLNQWDGYMTKSFGKKLIIFYEHSIFYGSAMAELAYGSKGIQKQRYH